MITMRTKLLFFDSPRVQGAMDAATRRALSKAGAFIRTRAKSSIRKRKAVSRPGKPPSSHTGHLKRRIFFAADPVAESVVIGPTPYREGEAPSVLEFGEVVNRPTERRGKKRRMVYRKRPFMGPALEAEAPNLPSYWRNGIRGG